MKLKILVFFLKKSRDNNALAIIVVRTKKGASRFELETYRSAVDCSTTELYAHCLAFLSGDYILHDSSDIEQ